MNPNKNQRLRLGRAILQNYFKPAARHLTTACPAHYVVGARLSWPLVAL